MVKNTELSGEYSGTKLLSQDNAADIDSLSGDLITTGQTLLSWVTGRKWSRSQRVRYWLNE